MAANNDQVLLYVLKKPKGKGEDLLQSVNLRKSQQIENTIFQVDSKIGLNNMASLAVTSKQTAYVLHNNQTTMLVHVSLQDPFPILQAKPIQVGEIFLIGNMWLDEQHELLHLIMTSSIVMITINARAMVEVNRCTLPIMRTAGQVNAAWKDGQVVVTTVLSERRQTQVLTSSIFCGVHSKFVVNAEVAALVVQ